MTATVMTTDFGASAKARINHLRLKKVIAVALFLACLFGGRAFADEKVSLAYSFAPLKAETALGFYVLDFRTLWSTTHFPSAISIFSGSKAKEHEQENGKEKASTLSDWSAGLGLAAVRPFESLPLSVFQTRASRFSRFEPGLGTYFPDDKIGRSRISGAGLEENRWFFFKLKFRF
jgi:hypothetical protein